MRIVLMPHRTPYFGQDFTTASIADSLDLTTLYLTQGEYQIRQQDLRNIDLIISRYPDRESDVLFIKKYKHLAPVIVHLHLRYDFLNSSQKENLKEVLPLASLLITNCKMLQEEYATLFPQYRWTHVNNVIDPVVFNATSMEERRAFKRQNNIEESKTVLCYSGRLNNAKGLQVLKKLLEFVHNSNQFFFCIQTIYHEKYQHVLSDIRERYKNCLVICDQDIRVLRYADALINTSLSETTSLVTLEALFSGVQVICTSSTSFYKEIESGFVPFDYFKTVKLDSKWILNDDGKAGLQLKGREEINTVAEDFIRQIKTISVHGDEKRKLLSQSFAKSKFSLSNGIKDLKKIYDDIAKYSPTVRSI